MDASLVRLCRVGGHDTACPAYRKLWRSQLEKYATTAKIRGADKLERKRHSKSNVMLMSPITLMPNRQVQDTSKLRSLRT